MMSIDWSLTCIWRIFVFYPRLALQSMFDTYCSHHSVHCLFLALLFLFLFFEDDDDDDLDDAVMNFFAWISLEVKMLKCYSKCYIKFLWRDWETCLWSLAFHWDQILILFYSSSSPSLPSNSLSFFYHSSHPTPPLSSSFLPFSSSFSLIWSFAWETQNDKSLALAVPVEVPVNLKGMKGLIRSKSCRHTLYVTVDDCVWRWRRKE